MGYGRIFYKVIFFSFFFKLFFFCFCLSWAFTILSFVDGDNDVVDDTKFLYLIFVLNYHIGTNNFDVIFGCKLTGCVDDSIFTPICIQRMRNCFDFLHAQIKLCPALLQTQIIVLPLSSLCLLCVLHAKSRISTVDSYLQFIVLRA